MALPGNAPRRRPNPGQQSAIHHDHQQGQQDGGEAALEPGIDHQESEVAENETAGPDVDGIDRGDEPRPQAANQQNKSRDHHKMALMAHHDQKGQDEEGDGIGQQVGETAMEHGGEEDAAQAR